MFPKLTILREYSTPKLILEYLRRPYTRSITSERQADHFETWCKQCPTNCHIVNNYYKVNRSMPSGQHISVIEMWHLGSKHNNRKAAKFRLWAQTPNSTICEEISRSNSPKCRNLVGGNVVHTKYHTARTCTVKTSSCSNTVDNWLLTRHMSSICTRVARLIPC